MSTPLSATGASSESHAWQELEEVFARLGQLARSAVAPQEFYSSLLGESVRALSALGGAVWLRAGGAALQPLAQSGWPAADFGRDEATRRAHESLLADAAGNDGVLVVAPRSGGDAAEIGNPTDHVLLLAPVNLPAYEKANRTSVYLGPGVDSLAGSSTLAIIEVLVRAGASPATYRGYEEFLTAVCDLAADYHTHHELGRLRQEESYRHQLLGLSREAHRQLSLRDAAYAVANEGRRVVGCNRLSVLALHGRRARLLATSGVSRPERRSGAARRLEHLATMTGRTDEPVYYSDGESDGLPPVAEALEKLAEESHARQIAALPLRRPMDPADAETPLALRSARGKRSRPQFVVVAEQFDAQEGELSRDRLVEAADVCTTALYNALEYERLPLAWLLRPLGTVKRTVTGHVPRTLAGLVIVAAAVTALVVVPADFNIESPGRLQPVVRRDVFAPRSGLVDEVLVAHGADVAAGQPLLRMRDPSLELELKRVDGELATAQRQLDAVRATRTNRAVRDTNPVDAYRLSAEERELQQRLVNLRRELDLLEHEREQLVVTSPIAGRVLTWDVANRLVARPVERGEALVTVADLTALWQLELDVPDDRIGYVLAAREAIQRDLPVRFRLSSDDREQHRGRIAEVCQTAEVVADNGATPLPMVLVRVALDTGALGDDLRPGVSARAQIACGRRPIGYVWFHDIWDTALEWLRF